jgi:uncharacterized membrane protein (UPF0127 family)
MVTLAVTHLDTHWGKSVGLIGKKTITPVYFQTRFGIHTFGVSVPIDVLILDHANRVVALKESLSPGRFFFWNPRYYRVVELPGGAIKQKYLSKGADITLRFVTD